MDFLGSSANVILVVAVVVIIIAIYVIYKNTTNNNKFLKSYCDGIWVIDAEFADQADLLEMMFFSQRELGYLFIMTHQGELFNGVIRRELVMDYSMDITGEIHGNLCLKGLDSSAEEVLRKIYPESIHVIVVPTEGTMIWKKQDETLAIFKKDTITAQNVSIE